MRRSRAHVPPPTRRQSVPFHCIPVLKSPVPTDDEEGVIVRRIPSAGILPYAIDPGDGQPRYLIGRERQHPGWVESGRWADFGGRREPSDVSIGETAAREAWEETMGMVHPKELFLERIEHIDKDEDDSVHAFDIGIGQQPTYYRIILMRVPYQDYNVWFQRARLFCAQHNIRFTNVEKDALAWVRASTLIAAAEACLRSRDSGHKYQLRINFARAVCALEQVVSLRTFH
jgi:8-oxo-dGTP pyrophosphatase MutT (NUDIX family)